MSRAKIGFCKATSLFFTILLMAQTFITVQAQAPNILLITADDLGFDDLSLHNHPSISTPNLDQLAKQSVQFSDFSVTPVCSTTRAALLTGRDFYKTGVSGVHGGRDFLQLSETLLSNILQDSGYKTATWGKWHLGKNEGYMPNDRGFDQAYYAELYQHQNSQGFYNGKAVSHNKWVSEVITDYAIDFISQQATNNQEKPQPFFAYASYLAPHEPWLAPEKYVAKHIANGERPAIANLYGMIEEMDAQIGRLLQHLDRLQLSQNTIVIFMSDNGPWWDSSNFGAMTKAEWQARNPSKLNGNKGQSWQNGIKSPLFVRYTDHWQPNTVTRYVDVKDIFPTLLAATKVKLPQDNKPLDGRSFLPYLEGKVTGENLRETYIASHDVVSHKKHFNQWTPIDDEAREKMTLADQRIGLRTEQYKLLLNAAGDHPNYPKAVNNLQLFDMQKDPLETTNIINAQPQVAKQLYQKLTSKFNQLLTDPNSYRVPVFIIGGANQVSVINGFGPAKTSGNVISKAHHLTGLKTKGDSAEYAINVLSSKVYDIYIKQANTQGSGISISLTTHMPKQSKVEQSLHAELNGEPIQKLGSLALTQGEQTLTLSVTGNHSQKPWAEISGFRRLILVPKDTPLLPQHLIMPN